MPVLKNQRHEAFAQEVAKGSSATKAYVVAGYAEQGAAQNASRLITSDKVQARIAELQGKVAAKVEITIERQLERMETIYTAAMEGKRKNLPMAANAVVIQTKLAGLWVEKRENTNVNADPKRMTDAELAASIDELRRKLAGHAEPPGAPGGRGPAPDAQGKLH